MDGDALAAIGFVLGIVIFDLAALRFGSDSRDGAREYPVPAEPSRPRRARRRRRQGRRVTAPPLRPRPLAAPMPLGRAQTAAEPR